LTPRSLLALTNWQHTDHMSLCSQSHAPLSKKQYSCIFRALCAMHAPVIFGCTIYSSFHTAVYSIHAIVLRSSSACTMMGCKLEHVVWSKSSVDSPIGKTALRISRDVCTTNFSEGVRFRKRAGNHSSRSHRMSVAPESQQLENHSAWVLRTQTRQFALCQYLCPACVAACVICWVGCSWLSRPDVEHRLVLTLQTKTPSP
jgi:hypothetical protein